MKLHHAVFFLFLGLSMSCSDPNAIITTEQSPYTISPASDLKITWKDEPLIISDSLSWIPGKTVGQDAEVFKIKRTKGWQTTNVWNSKSDLPYRRESGLSPDGEKIEITFQAHQEALMEEYLHPYITYKFILPASLFDDSKWDALTGRSQSAKWRKGTFSASQPDGSIINGARWISFTTKKGDITFDFNPHGVPTYYVTGINTMFSQWNITKKGEMIEMSFSTASTRYGGDLTGKVTIFEGNKDDYLNKHAVTFYHYFSELPAEELFSFSEKAGKVFTPADNLAFNEEAGFGWKNPDEIALNRKEMSGALYASCNSTKPNTFISQGLRPGLYLITIRSSALDSDLGNFGISFNGEKVYDKIHVKKGKIANMTFVRWIEGNEAQIQFAGNWGVSVIGFQLFMHREEDFQFRRGNWIMKKGFCPGILFADYYDSKPEYGKAYSESTLAGEVKEADEIPEFPELGVALPDQQSEELAWRFSSPVGTMGPDNWGTFNEFNTDSKIEKRLEQIKDGGISAVILNGMLSRHTYFTHLKRVENNIKKTVESAHKKGMKIIDHQDLTIVWNADMGHRFLAAHPGFLQYNHTNGLPTWGLCPVNPDFKEGYFFPYISEHIKNTNIDGLMLDETVFHYANFCNCTHCQKSFTDITGLVLPDDENSPLLHNKSSKLWKTWIEWRKHAMAEWRIDLSNLSHEINPYFCNMEYYSEGGFLLNAASYGQGGDLPLSAKSKDFLGTEIMSRDVWDDYRYNFTSRNMYNSLRETYGSPIFGLVYPVGVYNYAVIGWAMNNMFGQVTWSMVDFDDSKKMNIYTGWKENMNQQTSIPYTDIAIIFSRSTRDWSVKNSALYPKEIMGTGQFLSEKHIPHTFILDDAIEAQDFSRFRVLLAPGMDCISDKQENELRKFIFNGGTLFLTGDAGTLDPYGEFRATRAFSEILTDEKLNEATNKDFVESQFGEGRIIYSKNKYGLNEFCMSIRDAGMVYRFTPDPQITAMNQKILGHVIGAGKVKAISIPEKVLLTAYEDTTQSNRVVMVHLLNATGVKAKHGDKLPMPNPEWEPIAEDISFEISMPEITNAYYASPDAEGHKQIGYKRIGDERFEISVPVGTIDKYGIVYLHK